MIDLSFLTDEEQEAILQVLQRDADLKRVEEERIRHLPEKIKDDGQIKNMSGQWFYEAKSKRHREKIHGADIIRASMRRKPLAAELSQRKSDKKRSSWVNNVNKEVPTPSDLLEEKEGESKFSPSPVIFGANSNALEKPQDGTRKQSVSPSKERKNPFNDSTILDNHAKSEQPENGIEDLSESREEDPHSPSVDNQPRVTLTNHNRVHESEQALVETDELQRQAGRPPVPKARRNVHKTSGVSLKSDGSAPKAPGRIKQANGRGTPPRGILKRSSSSSSTDSEVLRLNQNLDPPSKSGLPAATILEGVAEKDASPPGEPEGFSQNSLERLKQVRFSSNVSSKGRLPSLELHGGKESGEFNLLDSDYSKSHNNPVGDSDGPQSRQGLPEKPPQTHPLILNGATTEDGGANREGETAPSSHGGTSAADLQSDTLQPRQSPSVEPLPPKESSTKTSPKVAEEQIAEIPPQSKAESEAISESTTGQQLLPLEEPQAPKVGSADLEQGKPALVEGQRAKTVSKPDKHAAEIEKAADESISKVLDWFKRTSSTAGREGVVLSPLEETDTLKATEDNELGTRGLNQDPPACEREEPANREYPFHGQPELPSFVRNEGPSSLLIEEQPSGSQSRRQDPAASVDDGQILPARVSSQLQIVDRGVNKTGETAVGASDQAKVEHPSFGEQKAFEENKPRTDSYFGKREKTDAEQDVKSALQEGSIEPQSGGSSEEPKQSGTEENTQFTNRGNPDLQDQEVKQSSSREIKKRIKDIRVLWERKQASNLGSKRELLNKNTTTSTAMLNSNKEPKQVKPVGGSSGYVTAESDSEQGKCNLVTFRKVKLNEDESEPDDDGLKSSFGMAAPRVIDNSKQSYPVEHSGKIFPIDQKKPEFLERPDGENVCPRPSTKEGGYLQPVVLQKEKTTSGVQQKTHFKIHSLKEQLDEDAKAQMLSPSQFQSLRSFWDAGVKPQSGSDEFKAVVAVPRSGNGRAGNNKKEAETVVSQNVLEGAQEKQFLQEVKVDKPNAKHSTQNILETSRVISTEAGPPVGSPSVDAAPKGSVEFVLGKDRYLEGKAALPAKEYIERTEVPSRGQLSTFNSGFQKLLVEAFQESPPAAEKGVPSLGLAVQEQMPLDDRVRQQQKLVPAGGHVEISASEVAEAANRTLAPLKADTGALDGGLEKQSTEAADARNTPKHSGADDVSGQAVPSSERRRFFNKVMERSHASYPSGQQKGTTGPEEAEDPLNRHDSPRDHHDEVKTGTESLCRPTEESHSIPRKAPDREEGHRCLEDRTSLQDAFQIPSVKLVLPDAGLAAQNKASSVATEVSETMTEVIVPSKKICSDMNAKIACLLDTSSTLPCVLPTTENALKTHVKDILGERQPGSSFAGPTLPSSPQRIGSLRDPTSESMEGSPKGNEDGGRVLTTAENELGEEASGMFSFRSQKNLNAEGYAISVDEPPKDVTETVVKTLKADSYEPTTLRASLRKFLREDSEVTEVSKPTQMPLETVQNVSSIYDTLAPHLPEIIETIEKTTLISNPRQSELKTSFQKLLKEESEILPANQESGANNNGIQIESKSNQSAHLFDQQETGKETSETGSPSKQHEAEVNSSLQKLLDNADWMRTIQLASLDPSESNEECPQIVKETVIKSTAPARDDVMFTSNLRKLIREHHDASLQACMEDDPRVTDNSTSPLKKQSSSVKMLASAPSASNEFRTEVKIPLKGKTSKQDNQTEEGVPERIAVFQKTIQVITSLAEGAHLDKGEEPPICSNKTGERKRGYDTQREAEVTIASLRGVNEAVEMVPGAQRSSTPCAEMESPLRVSNMKLHLSTQKADDKNNEEGEGDARSFGSDLSDENTSSFVRIQRNRTRSEEEPSPVMEALKRSSNRQIPSKSLEDIPSATSNQGKLILPKEDYMLSAEDVSTAPSFPDSQFSRPEKVKQMSKSVPAFVQEESDDRETDSASDSSYPLGRIKKSPSSLTNLSGSSGLASLSSVSTNAMSVYSGDFGNVDVKGNIQFAIDYVEQLKELHIFIAQGKDLAIADVKKQRSDPYVKSYLLPEKYKLGKRKTSVKKKTLNPVFNEILRYKVDKELLATQRLNISVWHSDIFGRNSFLGEVELDLASWDWNDKQSKQMIWYPLKPRTPLASLEAENRGEVKIALKYIPQPAGGKKTPATGEVHIWVKECSDLPILRNNKLNSFVKCTILPDTSRKSRQKTRAVANTTNPVFNHTMVYDGFRPEDLKEACVELTVWDHNKLANHFLGGLRIGLGTGKSYGTPVDWMDSTCDEINLWERMISSPNTWVEDTLPLRMLTIVKMAK